MNPSPRKIDAHAILGEEFYLALAPDELLRRMDAGDVETAIVRPMGAALVVDNREGNDALLYADPRLRAMVTANPWYEKKALKELKRCRDLGAVGLFLHPSRQGFMPTDEIVFPLVELAAEWNWPVMFHTGTYIQSDAIGLCWLAERFPQTSFIAGFGGFTDMWFDMPGLFQRYSNLFLDASMMWSDAILSVIAVAGAERVLFGSAEPRNRYQAAIHAIEVLELGEEETHLIFRENAARIFRIP